MFRKVPRIVCFPFDGSRQMASQMTIDSTTGSVPSICFSSPESSKASIINISRSLSQLCGPIKLHFETVTFRVTVFPTIPHMSKRKRYAPPGTEFEGKVRRLQKLANDLNVGYDCVRFANYLVWENDQWTVKEQVEVRTGEAWGTVGRNEN